MPIRLVFTPTASRLMNDQPVPNRLLAVFMRSNRLGAFGKRQPSHSKQCQMRLVTRVFASLLAITLLLFGARSASAQSIDLSVRQIASPKQPVLNSPVTYTVVIKNSGPAAATNVVVRDSLPIGGVTFGSLNLVRGTGVTTTTPADFIDITIPTLAPNDSVVLKLGLNAVAEGVWFNKVEVTSASETDINSTPGNHSLVENDYDATCFSVPLTWYDGDEFTVTIPSGYTDIKWYRYGVLVTATSDSAVVNTDGSLTIKGPGAYSFSTTRGGCTTGNCCDIIVRPGPVATIGDFVFEDKNGNGIQDAGELGIPNVLASLYLNGTLVLTTRTDANGVYSFTGLTTGSTNSYYVIFGTPTGYTATQPNVGNDRSKDSNPDPVTGRTASFTLAPNSADLTIDAGYYKPASLGDKVFADNNRNGIQDAGDTGIPGVTVTLISNGTVVATTTTNGDGIYSFTGLTPGQPYSVSFTTPTNYTATTPLVGNDRSIDSDILATGLTTSITLASGETNNTVDGGFLPATQAQFGQIGDFVWYDYNGDGQQGPLTGPNAEPGVPGVQVQLYNASTSALVGTTATGSDGKYLFSNLSSGTYYVQFGSTPGTVFTTQNAPGVPADLNSDAGPNGRTGVITIDVTQPLSSTARVNLTVDAGIVPRGSIGDLVFLDNNANGIQDDGPNSGAAGVTVQLYDVATGLLVDTKITDSFGKYKFDSLKAGNYQVKFLLPTSGFTFSPALVGNDRTIDSDANITTGLSGTITIDVTQPLSSTARNNNTVDAGLIPQCAIPVNLVVSNSTTICAGGQATLVASSTTTGSKIYWYLQPSGGDAFTITASGQNLVVSPQTPISYYAEAVTTAGCRSDRASVVVFVNPKPSTPVAPDRVTNACPQTTVDLTQIQISSQPQPGSVFEYHTTASPSSPLVANQTAVTGGQYYLFEKTAAGCYSDPKLITVQIINCACQTVAGVNVSGPNQAVCEGDVITVVATLQGAATSVTWTSDGTGTFSNPNSTSTTYTTTAADAAKGSVILTATTNDPDGSSPACSPATSAAIVAVVARPAAPVGVACDDTLVCLGNSTKLIGFAPGYSINWYSQNGILLGTTQSGGKLVVTPSTTGSVTYYAEAVGTNGKCPSRARTPVTVVVQSCQADLAVLKQIVTPGPYTQGQKVTYSITVTNNGPANAQAVTVSEMLSPSLTYVGSTPTGEYNPATGIWTIGALNVGSNRNLLLEATLAGTGAIKNVAIVKSPNNNPGKTQDDTSRVTVNVGGCTTIAPPTIYCAITQICKGEATTLTASDCAGTITWSDGQTGTSISVRPLVTTTYSATCVVGQCKSGKSTDITVTVTDLQPPTLLASSNSVCPGGSVTLTVTGCESGVPEWSEGQVGVASIVVIPTVKTTYTVQCRVNNCLSAPAQKTIDIGTDLPKPTVVCSVTAVCPGESVTLYVQNCAGTPMWSNGASTTSITVTPTITENSYTVFCKSGACSSPKSDVYKINVVTPSVPQVVASADTICVGSSLTLTASGCEGTVIWSTGGLTGSSIVVTPTATQSYYAQCKLVNCLSDRSTPVTVVVGTPTIPTVSIQPAKPLFCAGESVTLTASGCNGRVVWSTGAIGQTLSFVAGETKDYFAYCQLGTSCKSANSNTVRVNVGTTGTPPTVTASSLTICSGASITLTAANCAGTIRWSDNQTGASITVQPTTQVNEYYAVCTPTSGTACGSPKSATVKITVTTVGVPTVVCSTTVVCPGEKVTLTVNNCIGTPTWSTGATTASIDVMPTVTTGYSVFCTNGICVSPTSATYTIAVEAAPVPTVTASATSITAGDSVTLTATNCQGTVLWSNGQSGTSIVVQPSGTITYYAQCKYRTCLSDPSLLIKVNVPGNCLAKAGSLTTDTPIVCAEKGKTITITAKEAGGRFVPTGYSVAYVLTKGADLTVQQLGANPTFTVAADSATTFTIHTLVYDNNPSDKDYLNLSSVQLGVTKAADVVNLITTAKVCADLDVTGAPVKIRNASPPVLTTSAYQVCYGGTVSLTATGCSGQVAWSNGNAGLVQNLTLYQTTTLRATCTIDGCTSQLSNAIEVIVVKPNVPTIGATRLSVCTGETTVLTAVGCEQGVVQWSNQATGASITVTPTATVNEFSAKCVIGQCASDFSPSIKIEVGSPATPTASISGSTTGITSTTVCFGAPVTLLAAGCQPGNYTTWSNNMVGSSITITPSTSGTYSAQCFSSATCKSVASNVVSVVVLPKVAQPITADLTNTCPFKTVDITKAVTGQPTTTGGVFEYYTDAALTTKVASPATLATSGTYYVVEKSGAGCYSTAGIIHVQITDCNVQIACDQNPITVNAGVDASICAAKQYKLTGQTSGTIASVYWTGNGTGTFSDPYALNATYTPSLADIQTGLVSLTLTAKSNNPACPAVSDVMSLSIGGIKTIPVVKVIGSSAFCYGDSVILEADAGYSYRWSTKATTQRITVKNTGSYTVTLYDVNGCSSLPSAPVSITVSAPLPAPLVTNKRNICPATSVNIETVVDAPPAAGNTYEFRLGSAPVVNLLGNHQVNGPCYVYVYEKTPQGCYSEPGIAEVKIFDCKIDTLRADISISKTVDKPATTAGKPVKYTIRVTNNGPATATNVDIRDILPNGIAVVPGTQTFKLSNGIITKRFDSLAVGKSDSIVFFANIFKKGPILNTATITYADRTDPNTSNNSSGVVVEDTSKTPIQMLVGLAKNLVSAKMTTDSTFDVTYAFYVRNYGGTDLSKVSILDDLTGVFATHTISNIALSTAAGSTLVPNPAFTGIGSNKAVLDSVNSTLPAGSIASVQMKISVKINPADSSRTFSNTAVVTASASGTLLQDNSVAGADPDPDNDGNPNNNAGATLVTITPEAGSQLGVALAAVKTEKQPNDSYNVTYKVTVKNYGSIKLTNVSLVDSLSKAFAAPVTFSVVSGPTVSSSSSLVPVTNYDGTTNVDFLNNALSTLAAGATDSLKFVVNVVPNGKTGALYTSVVASASPENSTVVVRDLSNNGFDPKPEGSLATPVRFDLPAALIGVAKSVEKPVLVETGVYDVSYKIVLRNFGSVDLKKVQVVDNLNNTFGNGSLIVSNTVAVTTDTGLAPNINYSGQGLLTNLLVDSLSTLPAGATRSLSFKVRVNVKNADTLTFYNTAVAMAQTMDGSIAVKDTSTAGTNPDPNNTLDPRNNTSPTPVKLNSLSGSYLGLALSVKDTVRQKDGSYNVTYRLIAKNYGNEILTNVLLTDSLANVFNPQNGARFSFLGPVRGSAGSLLKLNPTFNGSTDPRLTLGDSTSKLSIGATDTLLVTINVVATGNTTIFLSTAYGSALSGTTVVSDLSTNGLNPDVNGNGNPTDSNESEATPLLLIPTVVSDIFIPEGFSPNGDGINDVFVIQGTQGLIVQLEVFNRWGNLVYKNDNYQNDWNGTSNTGLLQGDAQGLPNGTYFYVVKLSDGREYVRYMTINR